jgi:hypothetical protein
MRIRLGNRRGQALVETALTNLLVSLFLVIGLAIVGQALMDALARLDPMNHVPGFGSYQGTRPVPLPPFDHPVIPPR